MQLDFGARELTVKLVYYGPAMSGKTTNLRALHGHVVDSARGRLMTLETRDDRTLFFDLLPLHFTARAGLTVRLKLFTVPGQVMHNATRRVLLQGADGVAFIADSRASAIDESAEAFVNLRHNLRDNGLDPAAMPIVIQFNKRDLPAVRSDRELDALAKRGKEPVFKAVATRGVGVSETFLGLLRIAWQKLEQEHRLAAAFGVEGSEILALLGAKLARPSEGEIAGGRA